MKLRLTACIYVVLMLALAGFASTALAGGGHGNGNGHGNSGSDQQHQQHQQTTSQSSDQQQTTTSSSDDNSNGVKPSNSTQHDTHAKASSNKTKKYGNGKTAGQIATQSGYGDSTLHGPGNSQPHKVNCGGHEVDVHALKHKNCGAVEGAKHEEHHTTPAPSVSHTDHKITICHKTGSTTNPYVEITVDYHALKHGHTAAKGDIIPAPAGGCPTAAPAPVEVPTVSFCDMESATSGKLESKPATEVIKHELNGTPEELRDIVPPFTYNGQTYSQIWTDANAAIFHNGCQAASQVQSTTTTQQNCTETKVITTDVVVGVRHFIGPKGSGRFVIIHPNSHSSHFRDKHPDELITKSESRTETVPASCPSSTTTVSTTTTEAVTTTEQTTTTVAAAVAPSTAAPSAPAPAAAPSAPAPAAAPAGSVLGAVTPLHASKPKAAGGVLGTTVRLGKSVGGSTLPFTGLPLWIFAAVAIGLILIGSFARRASAER